jgi:hypothetical protein
MENSMKKYIGSLTALIALCILAMPALSMEENGCPQMGPNDRNCNQICPKPMIPNNKDIKPMCPMPMGPNDKDGNQMCPMPMSPNDKDGKKPGPKPMMGNPKPMMGNEAQNPPHMP